MNDPERPKLSTEHRKMLLAQLEASTQKAGSPDQIRDRAHQVLAAGQTAQARRLLDQLEADAPYVPGLDRLREQIMTSEENEKRQANLKRAEDMLTQAIQQRKKQLAQMALETLVEIAPAHPRLAEYEIWVRDLDQEVALQDRVDGIVREARSALAASDLAVARAQLESLRNLDPWNDATETLAEEISAAERGVEERSGIGKLKERIDEALAAGDAETAQRALEQLGSMDVPKITLDFYAKRIRDLRQSLQDEAESAAIEKRFQAALEAKEWQVAREFAREYGRRFPNDPHGTEMFNRVGEVEAGERRQASIRQGIQQVETALAAGDKGLAEMALRVLRGMGPDPQKLAELEAKIAAL